MPQLGSARNRHSSGSLEPENSSSNSSLLDMYILYITYYLWRHLVIMQQMRGCWKFRKTISIACLSIISVHYFYVGEIWLQMIRLKAKLQFLSLPTKQKEYTYLHCVRRSLRLFVCNRGDTIKYHGSLRSRVLGQAPMLLVFLTPRQALSSHPLKQMVWLYWLQEEIVCQIGTLSTILQHFTHTQWNPVLANVTLR